HPAPDGPGRAGAHPDRPASGGAAAGMALRRVGGVGHPLSSASAALFMAPGQAAPPCPWKLTPLLAQATAAWLIRQGVAASEALPERDACRLRPAGPVQPSNRP